MADVHVGLVLLLNGEIARMCTHKSAGCALVPEHRQSLNRPQLNLVFHTLLSGKGEEPNSEQ